MSEKKIKIIQERFKLAEFARVIYQAEPELGVTPEDMLSPEYWAHVAQQLQPGCRIEAIAEDNSWFAEFLVIRAERTWARVALLRKVVLGEGDTIEEIEDDEEGDVLIKWRGRHSKWSVVRKSDKEVLKEGMSQKQEAKAWLDEYNKAMG